MRVLLRTITWMMLLSLPFYGCSVEHLPTQCKLEEVTLIEIVRETYMSDKTKYEVVIRGEDGITYFLTLYDTERGVLEVGQRYVVLIPK